MKVYAKVDFQAGERACVKNAHPNHIGGQSPPFFACFDRICSLFRRFRSDEVYPYVMALFRLGYTIQASELQKSPMFTGF